MALEKGTQADTVTKESSSKKKLDETLLLKGIDQFHKDSHKNLTIKASEFKALDFSDVSIYGTESGSDKNKEDEKFRHFHQMRLFIKAGNYIRHRSLKTNQIMIASNLPEKIAYSLNSKWEAPLDFGDATSNLLIQMGAQALPDAVSIPSGSLRISSLKIWTKTEPLSLELTIPVLDDSHSKSGTNLVEALEILGSLCLPRYGTDTGGFFIPPPSPSSYSIKYTKFWKEKNEPAQFDFNNSNYARIVLQLGGILLIDHCVIESVSVNYPNTKAQIMHDYSIAGETFGSETKHKYLHPLLAEVKLKISTVEGLTADAYSRMLWARDQTGYGDGHFTTDIEGVTNALAKAKEFIFAEDKKPVNNTTTTNSEVSL